MTALTVLCLGNCDVDRFRGGFVIVEILRRSVPLLVRVHRGGQTVTEGRALLQLHDGK